jgi:branched-chain amino acid transport system ATP-binding protein
MDESFLSLKNIYCGYNGIDVIKGVSIDIPRGAVIGLVGPNGHGKTTILRAISGLVRLRSGSIQLRSETISNLSADRVVAMGVAHMPQGDLVFPQMSVRENLLMGAYLPAARAASVKQLDYVLSLFPKLSERAEQLASGLSGGERRMLGIGRGLMTKSDLIMIDEPSLGLAPLMIEHIYEVIRALKAEGRTLIVVEENVSRLTDLADELHLLDNGHFVWSGGGADLMCDDVLMKTYLGG